MGDNNYVADSFQLYTPIIQQKKSLSTLSINAAWFFNIIVMFLVHHYQLLVLMFSWVLCIQIPGFFGILALERAASRLSWCLGRTGKHLFLSDSENGKPPLLLQMANDCEDLKFM